MERLVLDKNCLSFLESIASTVPIAQILLKESRDLMGTVIRVIIECFYRDKYRYDCKSGRGCLATCCVVLPANDMVEDHHRHIRHLSHIHENLVISKIARCRAMMDSGVLENHGLTHKKVTKEIFTRAFSGRRRVNIAWRFHSGRAKMSKRWTKILDRTTSRTVDAH